MIKDTVQESVRIVETTLRKVWSVMDAAHEKPSPSQYLKPDAVRAIQGN